MSRTTQMHKQSNFHELAPLTCMLHVFNNFDPLQVDNVAFSPLLASSSLLNFCIFYPLPQLCYLCASPPFFSTLISLPNLSPFGINCQSDHFCEVITWNTTCSWRIPLEMWWSLDRYLLEIYDLSALLFSSWTRLFPWVSFWMTWSSWFAQAWGHGLNPLLIIINDLFVSLGIFDFTKMKHDKMNLMYIHYYRKAFPG